MSKETKEDSAISLGEESAVEKNVQQEEERMQETYTAQEKPLNITQYLSLYADKYESDMVLFFQNKFKAQLHSEAEWENTIAAFLEKTIV